MDTELKLLQKLKGEELEEYGAKIFQNIGLTCCYNLGQVKLNNITSGFPEVEHIEFDYIIPHNEICLIGEITARVDKKAIKKKYDKFVKQINIIKNLNLSKDLWLQLGVNPKHIKLFREIEHIKAFFIPTKKEKYDLTLNEIEDLVIFFKSDFLRVIEYSNTIGRWSKKYLLHNFNIKHTSEDSINIQQNSNKLIINNNKKVSSQSDELADLYTFTISPYKLLAIAHVCRKDELPNIEQDNNYNYQRLLNREKLQKIRETVLTDSDFIFPSNILAVLSKECKYAKDGKSNNFLYIPNQYGSIYIIDGQHRLFSYADEKVRSIMTDNCQIKVTAIDFETSDEKIVRQISAKLFIEINANQTKVEFTHLDQIAYELGSNDPKIIATRIIVEINNRQTYKSFFDINSDKIHKRPIDAGTIIDAVKKITNLNKIEKLKNARSGKPLIKKNGYEQLFDSNILELCDREILVQKGIVLLEKYFNKIFCAFKQDKIDTSKKINTSFQYSKFWAGFINLLCAFIEEGLSWKQVEKELESIKNNIMSLQNLDAYEYPLFNSLNNHIPDAKYSPTKVCKFLNENRQKAYSIQNIK